MQVSVKFVVFFKSLWAEKQGSLWHTSLVKALVLEGPTGVAGASPLKVE